MHRNKKLSFNTNNPDMYNNKRVLPKKLNRQEIRDKIATDDIRKSVKAQIKKIKTERKLPINRNLHLAKSYSSKHGSLSLDNQNDKKISVFNINKSNVFNSKIFEGSNFGSFGEMFDIGINKKQNHKDGLTDLLGL